jgi:hypothetical protein
MSVGGLDPGRSFQMAEALHGKIETSINDRDYAFEILVGG